MAPDASMGEVCTSVLFIHLLGYNCMKALLWLYMFVCHLDSIWIPLVYPDSHSLFPSHVDHCMQDLADCEHPWESEFSEPRSMPISASAGASDSEEHLVAVQGRLFEHSRFWIEELEVSEFVRGIILHGTNYHSGHSLLHYFPKIIGQLSSMLSLFRML